MALKHYNPTSPGRRALVLTRDAVDAIRARLSGGTAEKEAA